MSGINDTIKHITEMYQSFNTTLDAKLPENVVFTLIPNKGKARYLGWFARERWNQGENKIHEINIAPDFLNRPVEGIAETILHEMTHLKNAINGISDCTSSQYHKKSFKKQAEAFGLKVERAKNKGYAYTSLDDKAKAIVEKYMTDVLKGTNPFIIHRISEVRSVKTFNPKKTVAIDKGLAEAVTSIDGGKLSHAVDQILRDWVAENGV